MNKQDAFEAAVLILKSAGTGVLELAMELGVNIRESRPEQRMISQEKARVYLGISLVTFKKIGLKPIFYAGCKRYDIFDLDAYIDKTKKEKIGEVNSEEMTEAAVTAPAE